MINMDERCAKLYKAVEYISAYGFDDYITEWCNVNNLHLTDVRELFEHRQEIMEEGESDER